MGLFSLLHILFSAQLASGDAVNCKTLIFDSGTPRYEVDESLTAVLSATTSGQALERTVEATKEIKEIFVVIAESIGDGNIASEGASKSIAGKFVGEIPAGKLEHADCTRGSVNTAHLKNKGDLDVIKVEFQWTAAGSVSKPVQAFVVICVKGDTTGQVKCSKTLKAPEKTAPQPVREEPMECGSHTFKKGIAWYEQDGKVEAKISVSASGNALKCTVTGTKIDDIFVVVAKSIGNENPGATVVSSLLEGMFTSMSPRGKVQQEKCIQASATAPTVYLKNNADLSVQEAAFEWKVDDSINSGPIRVQVFAVICDKVPSTDTKEFSLISSHRRYK